MRSAVFAMILLALGAEVATQPAPAVLTLLAREGRRAIPLATFNNQDYVAVDDLAAPFGTAAREVAGGLTIVVRGRTIVVTADQTVVSVAGRLVSLPAPALRRDNRWFVPVDFLTRALSVALDTRIDWRRSSGLLIVGDLRVPRVMGRMDAGAASATVAFDVTPATTARVVAESGRLVVQFEADALELHLPTLPLQAFVSSLVPGDTANTVVIGTGPRYAAYRLSTSQQDAGSSRVSLDLLPSSTDAATPAAPPALAPPDLRPSFAPPPAGTGLRTVVIDPGHGGDELGTQGSRGTLEKDITVAVARRLRTLIESRMGLRVFLTREDDRILSLDERSSFANNHQADVFLSIHANASVRPAIKGAEIYYLTVERADTEARKRAEDEGTVLPALGGGARTIDLILWETAQSRFLEQSSALAGLVEQSLRARVEMSPRAVQQAPFRVLVGANMPAVLVEIGYLSSPAQEQQLASAGYQDAVCEALFDALARFRAIVDRETQ